MSLTERGWGLGNTCPSRDPEACREQEDNGKKYNKGAQLPLGLENNVGRGWRRQGVRLRDGPAGTWVVEPQLTLLGDGHTLERRRVQCDHRRFIIM